MPLFYPARPKISRFSVIKGTTLAAFPSLGAVWSVLFSSLLPFRPQLVDPLPPLLTMLVEHGRLVCTGKLRETLRPSAFVV